MSKHEDKNCKKHGIQSHFSYKAPDRPGGIRWVCKKCAGEAVSKRQRKVKAALIEYKGGSCERCGYNRYQGALEFHHRDPKLKEFSIQSGVTKALHKMKAEADKCDLLCANCHREVEHEIKELARLGNASI